VANLRRSGKSSASEMHTAALRSPTCRPNANSHSASMQLSLQLLPLLAVHP